MKEETWQRVEQSARICEFSARVCEFSSWAIEDGRRTCLYQNAMLKHQRERLTTIHHKLSAQRGRLRKEEAEAPERLSG